MEKKTIGAFIAVLRKAAGMTQRELAEKLNVSDKTVSRWERDECAPDLSLIPMIADMFGITADELLRGEYRPTSDIPEPPCKAEKPMETPKAAPPFHPLQREKQSFRDKSLIALVISIAGFVLFLGLMLLLQIVHRLIGLAGFSLFFAIFVALAAFIAALLLMHFALRSLHIPQTETVDEQTIHSHQNEILRKAAAYTTLIWLIFGAELAITFHIYFKTILDIAVCALIFAFLGYLFFECITKTRLAKSGIVHQTASKREIEHKKRKLLVILTVICAILTTALFFVQNKMYRAWSLYAEKQHFYDVESFKAYAEAVLEDMDTSEARKYDFGEKQIVNDEGEVVCQYHWRNPELRGVSQSIGEDFHVYIYTDTEIEKGERIANIVTWGISALTLVEILTFAGIYLKKAKQYDAAKAANRR